jgi:phosphoglycolate phosphatase
MQIRRPHPIRALQARAQARAEKKHAELTTCPFTIVYDFDGTVANTIDEMLRIYNEVAQEKGYKQITLENMAALKRMSIKAASEELDVPTALLPLLLMQGKRRLSRTMGSVPFFPDIPKVLIALQKMGCEQVIATSNSKKNVNTFLAAHSAGPLFAYLECNIGIFGKARRLKKMMKRQGLAPERVIYVGDELRDIEAARTSGLRVISVTWGLNDESALEEASPDFIARTPEKLQRIIMKLCKE